MKIMNQLLKSKKLLQDLPNRIIMAAMTIKSSDKRESAPENSKEAAPPEPMEEDEPVMKVRSI